MMLPADILRSTVGSGLHGIAIEGTDDNDEMGVFIEPPSSVFGVAKFPEHEVVRTQPEGARSGPGDTDLVRYSLRKYLRLAVQGNPTILLPLYAPESALLIRTPLGMELRAMRESIVSRRAGPRFLGYMIAQRERLQGLRGRRGVNRPELIEKYGYDTKYASHAVRLGMQGVELLTSGLLTLPMLTHERSVVLNVKQGHYELDVVVELLEELEEELREALECRDALPDGPDFEAIAAWSHAAHVQHWSELHHHG